MDLGFRELVGRPEPCPYLDGLSARMRYRVFEQCSPETYACHLARGWRRFGRVLFRPACPSCGECVGLRVDVPAFAPNRSMRRTGRKNADLEIEVGPPRVDRLRLDLYRRYHEDMAERRGWKEKEAVGEDEYASTFVEGGEPFARELVARLEGRPVLVALHDRVPNAMSAVYTYYEPSLRSRGLGVLAVLELVRRAAAEGRRWLYLGYRVAENPSMSYKARYRPHQLLSGRPGDRNVPEWTAGDGR